MKQLQIFFSKPSKHILKWIDNIRNRSFFSYFFNFLRHQSDMVRFSTFWIFYPWHINFVWPLKIVVAMRLRWLSLHTSLYFLKKNSNNCRSNSTGLQGAHLSSKIRLGVEVSITVYKIDTSRQKIFWGPCEAKMKIVFWLRIGP